MFDQLDTLRRQVSTRLDQAQRAQLGQFMTPSRIVRFMASLFTENAGQSVTLLDAGAGIGSLTAAFLERLQSGWSTIRQLQATAYEIDPALLQVLKNNLQQYQHVARDFEVSFTSEVRDKDFVKEAIGQIKVGQPASFDYAILNPPYKKIGSDSAHRQLLRQVGIETVNLYTAFVALSLQQLRPGGQLVALIPRSFCNGPYYRPFREQLLRQAAIRQIHLFESRSKPFGEDAVLQENIVIYLVKGQPQGKVMISTSTDDTFADLQATGFDFEQIVKPDDAERFIHIPTGHQSTSLALPSAFGHTLSQLGLTVSTGPVVDFRSREYLRMQPNAESVPLLYPAHFAAKHLNWPLANFKKANAIALTKETLRWLYPAGFYVAVKRFSSKEEKKRIVARVISPQELPGSHYGFENHLNVFHCRRQGVDQALALGLAVYLNSTIIDQYFRQFNGHTQVNATDLRLLTYPSQGVLLELGVWAGELAEFDQLLIDEKVASLL